MRVYDGYGDSKQKSFGKLNKGFALCCYTITHSLKILVPHIILELFPRNNIRTSCPVPEYKRLQTRQPAGQKNAN